MAQKTSSTSKSEDVQSKVVLQFGKTNNFSALETLSNRSVLDRVWISGECPQEQPALHAASNCGCRLYAASS